MARGLAVPIRMVQGRTVMVEGADQIEKLIQLAVAEAASSNPFNTDVGVQAPIFDLQDAAARAILSRRVRQHFDRWQAEGRAELLDLQILEDSESAETTVEILYRDLETDEERPLQVQIGSV